jgi:hypothetical protein
MVLFEVTTARTVLFRIPGDHRENVTIPGDQSENRIIPGDDIERRLERKREQALAANVEDQRRHASRSAG